MACIAAPHFKKEKAITIEKNFEIIKHSNIKQSYNFQNGWLSKHIAANLHPSGYKKFSEMIERILGSGYEERTSHKKPPKTC